MNTENNKTNAIKRIMDIKDTWCNDIEHNDGSMRRLLYEIASDIYEGYVTYEAFLSAITDAAEKINFHSKNSVIDGEEIDKNIFIVKNEVFSKISGAYTVPNCN